MVSDISQAIGFYVETLGLTLLNRYGEHYAELDANGFMIALHPLTGSVTYGNNASIGLGVFHFDQTIKDLESKGVIFKMETGGYIRQAHFKDPDGNQLFLAENK